MTNKKNSGRRFDYVVDNIARTLVKEIEYHDDTYVGSCNFHPRFRPMSVGGYKCVHFDDFADLDKYLSEEDPNWRKSDWAKFWLRDHWAFQTSEYEREELHDRGVTFQQRKPGSVRHTKIFQGPKRLSKRVPPATLAAFIESLMQRRIISLRDVQKAIKVEYDISLSLDTLRRIKKKYNV